MDVRHESQSRKLIRRVFFTGSTAVLKGHGFCYDRDYGTAATAEGRRDNYVELPSLTNALWFAGVAAANYSAVSGGQWIDIYEPGSVCDIACPLATTVAATLVTCIAGLSGGAGKFGHAGFPGRGSALALQTQASSTDAPIVTYVTGTGTINSTTLTQAGATFQTSGVQAGDKVLIFGGANGVTAGEYVVASVTSETVLVLTTAPSASSLSCSFTLYRGNPTILAYLMPGDESGLVEYVAPRNGATAFGLYGASHVLGGYAPGGNATYTLADGSILTRRKSFDLLAAITTQSLVITVTSGVQMVKATALATLTAQASGLFAYLDWVGTKWNVMYTSMTQA